MGQSQLNINNNTDLVKIPLYCATDEPEDDEDSFIVPDFGANYPGTGQLNSDNLPGPDWSNIVPKEEIEERIVYEEISRPDVEPVPPAQRPPPPRPPVVTYFERPKVVSTFSERLNLKISNVKSLRKIDPSEVPSPTVILRCKKCDLSFKSDAK